MTPATSGAGSVSLRGVGVSPGRAVGPVALFAASVPEPPIRVLGPDVEAEAEAARITQGADAVAATLVSAASTASGTSRQVLETTAQMAADPALVSAAQEAVRGRRLTPERAVWEAGEAIAAQLADLGGYMAERSRDVHDVRDRLVAHLTGQPVPGPPQREEPYVLVSLDLAPADTAQLDATLVRAIVTAEGGPTSHTAILARALGIPAVVGADAALTHLHEDAVVLVDGAAGTVEVDPSPEQVASVERLTAQHRFFDGVGRTGDGHRVELLANVGEPSGAAAAAAAGAEGVGLFRTEFCFLDRETEPGVEEQVHAYRRVFSAFAGKKVVIRVLDAGADKPMPFLTDTSEPNPALGVRGLRTSWRNPTILENQLRAIAEAAGAESARVWVMAPMVSTVAETEEFVAACARHGLDTAGVMVEVPSAALLAGPILARAAFASIGTNDLIQYTLAADRLLGSLASLSDPFQPAVLRLIAETCAGGAQQDRPVGVCGEAAADPAVAVVLVGLGIRSLSMTPRALPDVAAVLGSTSLDTCRDLAQRALMAESSEQARALVRKGLPILEELGL